MIQSIYEAHLADMVKDLRAALNQIAAHEPELNTMPIGEAFSTLREVTKIARVALSATQPKGD
jgi:hypothetical protein